MSAQHRAQRREQILDGARRAFARHGYAGTTVARLEAETGLSRGAIFSYYPHKLDVFLALVEADRRRAAELWMAEGFEAVARHIAVENPDWIGVYLEALRMLRTDPAVRERWGATSGDIEEHIEARYRKDQQDGVIRADIHSARLLRVAGLVLDGLATQKAAGVDVDVEPVLTVLRDGLSAGPQTAAPDL